MPKPRGGSGVFATVWPAASFAQWPRGGSGMSYRWQSFESATPRYQLSVIVAQYAEVLRQSPWAQQTSLSTLYHMSGRLLETLPEDADVSEFVNLLGRASQIRH